MDQQRTQLENGVQEIDAVKRKLQQNVSEVIDLYLTCFPVSYLNYWHFGRSSDLICKIFYFYGRFNIFYLFHFEFHEQ